MMVKQEPTDYTYDPGKCRLVFSISDYHPYQAVIEPVVCKATLQKCQSEAKRAIHKICNATDFM